MTRPRNWFLWGGLALSIFSFLSYPILFSRWPATRDVPWANYLLFTISIVLLLVGLRRAAHERHILRGLLATVAGAAIFAIFVVGVTVLSRHLPTAHPPAVGQKAPEFAMRDSSGKPVALSQLVAAAPHGVLLIFYRGYW